MKCRLSTCFKRVVEELVHLELFAEKFTPTEGDRFTRAICDQDDKACLEEQSSSVIRKRFVCKAQLQKVQAVIFPLRLTTLLSRNTETRFSVQQNRDTELKPRHDLQKKAQVTLPCGFDTLIEKLP